VIGAFKRERVVAGADISTTGARVVFLNERGEVAGKGSATFTESNVIALEHQDPSTWLAAIEAALTQARRDSLHPSVEVVGIGIASQGITVLASTVDGQPERDAISWLSLRTRSQGADLNEQQWFAASGRRLTPAFLAVQARERRNVGQDQPAHWTLVGEVIAQQLTDVRFVDPCLASTTGLLDPRTRRWSSELLSICGLSERQLPLIDDNAAPSRTLGATKLARSWDLGPEVVVAPPTQDQRAAVSVADPTGQALVVTAGTAAAIVSRVPEALIDPEAKIPITPSLAHGAWELEGVVGTAGASLTWAAMVLGYPTVNELLDDAETAPPGAKGVEFSPHLAGATSPDWSAEARAGFSNLALDAGRAELARAVIEGVCAEVGRNCIVVEELGGSRGSMVMVGGLARHALVPGILAAMLNRPIRVIRYEHPTALGAALRAAQRLDWDIVGDLTRLVANGSSLMEPNPFDVLEYKNIEWREP
jgi:xylulokinase